MFISKCLNFLRDEDGAVAIEYALLAALIAVVIAAGATLLGDSISKLFTDISECLPDPSTCALLN
jgi:pilus assembly protein Flp/PilA